MTSQRVVVISGGSRGLGQSLVERFLRQGDLVATFSRSRTPFVERTLQAPQWQGRFHYSNFDATDTAAVKQFISNLYKQHQRIDVLINNAAIAHDGMLATFPEDRLRQVIEINLTASLMLTKACIRFMLLRAQGRILNISSIIGLRGYAGLAVYSATKAGLIGATRALARELGPKNITVNAIAPGYLETEMSHSLSTEQKQQIIRRTPLGRLGTADDVAALAEFLSTEAAGFITGQVILVDGGISC